jgi:hypothetical protein
MALDQHIDAGSLSVPVEQDALHQCIRLHHDIRTLHGGVQVGRARRIPLSVAGVDIVDTVALEPRTVEIVIRAVAQRGACLEKRLADRMHRITRDVDLAAAAMPFGIARMVRFQPLEPRQHVVPAPAGIALRGPVVEILPLAAHIDHCVDRA